MLKTIDEALRKVDELPMDDCLSLSKILLEYDEPSKLAEINATFQANKNGHDGIYFGKGNYKFYALQESKDMIDFISKNYLHKEIDRLFKKIMWKSDPRNREECGLAVYAN